MADTSKQAGKEIPLSWFTVTLKKYTPFYVEIVFISILLRLIGLVEPFVFQVIIDRILPFQREASLLVVAIIFAVVSFYQIGFSVLSALLGVLTGNKVTRELGNRIFDHLFKLPFQYFRKWNVGETIARVGETGTIRNFLVGTTTGVFLDLLFVFVYLFILFSLSTQLTIIVLAALPLQIAIYLGFGPFLRKRLRKRFDTGAAHQTQLVENISGIAAVKALSAEADMLKRLDGTLSGNLDASYRVTTLNLWSRQLSFVVRRSVEISIIYIGSSLVLSGELTLGQLIAFHIISQRVSDPIANFSGLWEAWQNIKVSRQRLGDIVSTPTEPFNQLPKLPINTTGKLIFNCVSFHYVPGKPILENFNFVAEPKTISLVVGPSGIGKSTFGKLSAGIDAPTSGKVELDGYDISKFDPHNVRNQIAYIPQEPFLFSGTLKENLLLGKEDATDTDIRWALKVAAADEIVAQLPEGIDTHIGERGSALSGGQRQRISIARTIIKQPKVIILDEPTSALDEKAQQIMTNQLQQLSQHSTIIVITHRPDVFENPDQIIDFGEGS